MRFLDLGDLRFEVGNGELTAGGRRPARALSVLLMHPNRRVSVDLLLDAVWGDDVTPGASSTLETHIWRLRRLIEPDRRRGAPASVLINDSGGYRLVVTDDQVDSARFEQLCLEVVDLLSTEQHHRALRAADDALALWRGAPFDEIADRPWAGGPIARLRELQAQLVERRVDAILATDQASRAVAELVPLLAAHPFRERLWWQRMLALYRNGRTEEALQAYRSARRVLRDEVGLEPGRALVELQQRILSQDPALELSRPRVSVEPSRRGVEVRLPRPRDLIAREVDQQALVSALSRAPLVTVTGPAGCGKTRLAVEAARSAAEVFPDGVWFVDLADAEEIEEVGTAITAALGVVVPPGGSIETTLASYSRDRRALLLLDNCEQALDAVAAVCEVVLGDGRQLCVLATSREPIGLAGEVVHPLESLPHEPSDGVPGPAVRLFLQRAGLDQPEPSRTDLDEVARICRAVDGLPLAIELAAALAPTYGLHEIAELVESDPGGLTAIGRGHARHHETLASAIDRSCRLLGPDEQMLYRRLSVLPSGFSRDLAAAVAQPDLGRGAVPALLARLVHRSLLTVTRGRGGDARFQQLAPIRAHAAQALAAAGETDSTERERDEWTRALIRRRPKAGRPEERDWYDTITDNLATVRASLQRRLLTEPDELGAEIAPQLVGYWYYHGLIDEARRWTDAAIGVASDPATRQLNQVVSATFLLIQGLTDRARALLGQAMTALPAGSAVGAPLAERLMVLATQFAVEGDATTARQSLALAAETVRTTEDLDLRVIYEAMSCTVDSLSTPPERTLARGADCYRRSLEIGNLFAAWMSCSSVDAAALALRDPGTGLLWCPRLLDLQERISGRTMPHQLETLGDFLALDGQHDAAVRIFSLSYQRARRAGWPFPRNPISTELLAQCQQQLSVEEFDEAWAVGPTLDWRDSQRARGWAER